MSLVSTARKWWRSSLLKYEEEKTKATIFPESFVSKLVIYAHKSLKSPPDNSLPVKNDVCVSPPYYDNLDPLDLIKGSIDHALSRNFTWNTA